MEDPVRQPKDQTGPEMYQTEVGQARSTWYAARHRKGSDKIPVGKGKRKTPFALRAGSRLSRLVAAQKRTRLVHLDGVLEGVTHRDDQESCPEDSQE